MMTDSNNRFRVIINFSLEIFFGVIRLVRFCPRGKGGAHSYLARTGLFRRTGYELQGLVSYTRYTISLAVACVTAGPRIVRTIGIVRLWFSNTITCTKSQTVYTGDFPFEPTGSNLWLKHILIPADEKYFRFFIHILVRPKKDVSTVLRQLRSQGRGGTWEICPATVV